MKRFVGMCFVDDVEEQKDWIYSVAPPLSAKRGIELARRGGGEAENLKVQKYVTTAES